MTAPQPSDAAKRPDAEAVAEWLSTASNGELRALAQNVHARRSLLLAYSAMKNDSDANIKSLALEVEDVLRRLGSEEAALGLS